MPPSSRGNAVTRSFVERVAGGLRRFRSSPWSLAVLRVAGAAVVVIVLALIGTSAHAVPQTPSLDAGAASTDSSSVPAPVPLPAPPTSVGGPSDPSVAVEHSQRATPDDPVHLNSAALADLERLPGIGPKRATAILALRARLGRFRAVEDLMRVKGVGRATVKKLRPLVRLD